MLQFEITEQKDRSQKITFRYQYDGSDPKHPLKCMSQFHVVMVQTLASIQQKYEDKFNFYDENDNKTDLLKTMIRMCMDPEYWENVIQDAMEGQK